MKKDARCRIRTYDVSCTNSQATQETKIINISLKLDCSLRPLGQPYIYVIVNRIKKDTSIKFVT